MVKLQTGKVSVHLATWRLLEGVGLRMLWSSCFRNVSRLNLWKLTALRFQDFKHHFTLGLFVLICEAANLEQNY